MRRIAILALACACSAPAKPTAVQSDDLGNAPYAAPNYGVEHLDRTGGHRVCAPIELRYSVEVAVARWYAALGEPFELLCHDPTVWIAWGQVGDLAGHAWWDGDRGDVSISPDVPARKLIPVVTHELGHVLSPVNGPHHHDGRGVLGSPWADEITAADLALVEGRAS